tara:strand:- start:216 stop:434 length:219 start_codon:yes stop_codon:yes gene_type:complete
MTVKEESHLDMVLLGAHVQEKLKKTSKELGQIRAWADEATPDQQQDPDNVCNMLITIENLETLVNDLLRSTK